MDTPEYQFSKQITENAILAIIKVYEEIGMEVKEIIEYIRTDEDIKDHIDAKFILNSGAHTWQIKVLNKWDWKDNFTIEFMQDRYRRVLGEVAEIKAQLYFHSYYNEKENYIEYYIEYHIINVPAFLKWFNTDLQLREVFERPAGGSNASFYYRRYDAFHPNSKVIVRRGKFDCA